MDSGAKFLSITAVIVLAVMLQVFLVVTENRETAARAAVDFARAYYQQDASMADRLCQDILENEETDPVADYINHVSDEAARLGFDASWMKMALGHVKTKTHLIDENTAEVTIKASMRRNINPLFYLVSRVFFLGETLHMEETLTLVKEDNRWKVCDEPLALPTI
jgi:hypothetical protein